jgi:hypothetical protein
MRTPPATRARASWRLATAIIGLGAPALAAQNEASPRRPVVTCAAAARARTDSILVTESGNGVIAEDAEDRRRAQYARRGWSEDEIAAVLAHRTSIGMTPEMVRAAWRAPATIYCTITVDGTSEQWLYYRGQSSTATYVYFERGKVTMIQDSR